MYFCEVENMQGIDFKLIAGVMLFVILISIHITLNKILVILKEIKRDIKIRNNEYFEMKDGPGKRY